MSLNFKEIIQTKSVAADWIDLRDQEYVPNLSVLKDEVSLNNKLMPIDAQTGLKTPIFGLRNQGKSGRCVGFAMANLADNATPADKKIVKAHKGELHAFFDDH